MNKLVTNLGTFIKTKLLFVNKKQEQPGRMSMFGWHVPVLFSVYPAKPLIFIATVSVLCKHLAQNEELFSVLKSSHFQLNANNQDKQEAKDRRERILETRSLKNVCTLVSFPYDAMLRRNNMHSHVWTFFLVLI